MGIKIEFNPDIALRSRSLFESGERKEAECLPAELVVGEKYAFLKEGQRNYWFDGELALLETKGSEVLSRPLASIIVLEATHYKEHGVTWTRGFYEVKEVFNDDKIHFDWMVKVDQ